MSVLCHPFLQSLFVLVLVIIQTGVGDMNHCLYNIIGAQEQKNVLVSVMSIVEDRMEAHTETIPTTTAVHVHTIMELGEVFLYIVV